MFADLKKAGKGLGKRIKQGIARNAIQSYTSMFTNLKYYGVNDFTNDYRKGVKRRMGILSYYTDSSMKSFDDFKSLNTENNNVFEDCDLAKDLKRKIQGFLISKFTKNNAQPLTDIQKEILNMITMIGTQEIKKDNTNNHNEGNCVLYSKFTGTAYNKGNFQDNINTMINALKQIRESIEKNKIPEEALNGVKYSEDDKESDKDACDKSILELQKLNKLNGEFDNFGNTAAGTEGTQGGRKSKKARKGRKGRRTKNKRKRQTKKKRGKKRH